MKPINWKHYGILVVIVALVLFIGIRYALSKDVYYAGDVMYNWNMEYAK